jgi:hypothetical protein
VPRTVCQLRPALPRLRAIAIFERLARSWVFTVYALLPLGSVINSAYRVQLRQQKVVWPKFAYVPANPANVCATGIARAVPMAYGSSIACLPDRHFVPVEIRPHVGATLAACLADKPRLEVVKPNINSPSIAADSE